MQERTRSYCSSRSARVTYSPRCSRMFPLDTWPTMRLSDSRLDSSARDGTAGVRNANRRFLMRLMRQCAIDGRYPVTSRNRASVQNRHVHNRRPAVASSRSHFTTVEVNGREIEAFLPREALRRPSPAPLHRPGRPDTAACRPGRMAVQAAVRIAAVACTSFAVTRAWPSRGDADCHGTTPTRISGTAGTPRPWRITFTKSRS